MKGIYMATSAACLVAATAATPANAGPNNIYRWNAAQNSEFVPGPSGCATSIGVGPSAAGTTLGTPWTTGCTVGSNGNYTVYELVDGAFKEKELHVADQVAVSPNGVAWAINAANQVLYWSQSAGKFEAASSVCATSIAVGTRAGKDDPWITDCAGGIGANHNVLEYGNFTGAGANGTWTTIQSADTSRPSQVAQIAMTQAVVGGTVTDFPWALYFPPTGSADNILFFSAGSFFSEAFCGTSIAGGPDGNALVTGCKTYPDHNFDVYTATGQLMQMDAAVQVALSPDTNWPWAIKYEPGFVEP